MYSFLKHETFFGLGLASSEIPFSLFLVYFGFKPFLSEFELSSW